MRLDFKVDGFDWRQALSAVLPHASTDPDNHLLHRLRVVVGIRFVTLIATSGFSAAMARVEIKHHGSPELGCFDFHPRDVKRAIAFFGKSDDQTLQVIWEEKSVEIRDVGGLFDGEAITITAHSFSRKYPNVAATIELVGSIAVGPGEGARIAVPGRRLALFAAASKAFGNMLVIEPSGPWAAPIISCGDSFIGLLVPEKSSPATNEHYDSCRDGWLETFHDISASHPVDLPEIAEVDDGSYPVEYVPDVAEVDDGSYPVEYVPDVAEIDALLLDLSRMLSGEAQESQEGDGQADAVDDEPIAEYDHDSQAAADDGELPPIESVPMFEDAQTDSDLGGDIEWYDGFPSRGEDDLEGADIPAPVIPADELDLLTSAVQDLSLNKATSMRQLKMLLGVGQAKAQRVMELLREFRWISGDGSSKAPADVLFTAADLPDIFAKIDAERRRGGSDV